jgi:hypothetical protein
VKDLPGQAVPTQVKLLIHGDVGLDALIFEPGQGGHEVQDPALEIPGDGGFDFSLRQAAGKAAMAQDLPARRPLRVGDGPDVIQVTMGGNDELHAPGIDAGFFEGAIQFIFHLGHPGIDQDVAAVRLDQIDVGMSKAHRVDPVVALGTHGAADLVCRCW